MRLIRLPDLIIIALLTAAAVAMIALREGGGSAVIRIDGEVVKTVSLTEDAAFTIDGAVFTVRGGRIAITENDCPGGQCVSSGFIDSGMIICAPKRISVEIERRGVDAVIG